MKPTKKHFSESRDREADLNTLADSFFDYLVLNATSRSNVSVWGIDPQWLLGRSRHGKNKVALEVLDVLDVEPGHCDACGQSVPSKKHTSEQIEYANELWSDLGDHITARWKELRSSEEEEDSDDEEEEEVCSRCGEPIQTGGCELCDSNDEDDDVYEESDEEEEEDDE